MKKLFFLALLPLTSFAGTTVIQNYPNDLIVEEHPYKVFGVQQPNHCRTTFNYTTRVVTVEQKPGVPALKDAASCTRSWLAAIPSRAEPK
jgi:hypothetical protein